MTQIFNQTPTKEFRKDLRNNISKSERLLWSRIRNKQIGYRFRRQYGIGNYIVDFYCPELRLIIEVDGIGHITPEETLKDNKPSYH